MMTNREPKGEVTRATGIGPLGFGGRRTGASDKRPPESSALTTSRRRRAGASKEWSRLRTTASFTSQLALSSKSATGYKCVVEERKGEFHAKITPVRGGGQAFLPGGACKTAQEAALRLAKYKANPQPIEVKKRAADGTVKVCGPAPANLLHTS